MTLAVLPSIILSTAVSEQEERPWSRWFHVDDTPSVSLDEIRNELLESLHAASDEASRPGWDGYGALPASDSAITQALAFLDLLPSALMSPEISAHPDGELAFEWYVGPRWLLTVSINGSGRLSYAGVFGLDRVHGTEWLLDAIPQQLAGAFQKLHRAG